MSQDVEEYESERSKLVFPILPIALLSELCDFASKIFAEEPMVVNLEGDFIIVGDLHGHILDLFRILRRFGHPPKQSYIFLGDLVDRGEFSTETVVLIYLMKCLYPENIYIIRGNHEFTELWPTCGFLSELETLYNESRNSSMIFMKSFSYLPIAATVNNKYLCVHGGIGPEMPSLSHLNFLDRPIMDFDSEPVLSIVWSDLSNSIREFAPSTRGTGYFYGDPALAAYLSSQNLELLVRGHQCVFCGVEYSLRKKCVTVFSASNYCGVTENDGGVLHVKIDEQPKSIKMKALTYIKRENALFLKSSSETSFMLSSKPISLYSDKVASIAPSKSQQNGFPKLNKNTIKKDSKSSCNNNSCPPHPDTARNHRNNDRHKDQPQLNGPCIVSSSQGFYNSFMRTPRTKQKKQIVQSAPVRKIGLQSIDEAPKVSTPQVVRPPVTTPGQRKRRTMKIGPEDGSGHSHPAAPRPLLFQ